MKYYYPDYFYNFQCVPGHACPDSCCIRWQITVDKRTLKKYRQVGGELGKRMKEKIDFSTGNICPHGDEHRCEFLNDDNLCDIVLELGEDALSETCHTHPRHEEVYLNVRERSLAMTCPIACKQLLQRKKPVQILMKEEKTRPDVDLLFDRVLFEELVYTRDALLDVARNRENTIFERMIMILGLAHDVESRIHSRSQRNASKLLARKLPSLGDFTDKEKRELRQIRKAYRSADAFERVDKRLDDIIYDEKYFRQESDEHVSRIMTDMLFALTTMDALKPEWPPYLQSIFNVREEMSREESAKQMAEYSKAEEPIQLEQLLVYFLYVYCCTSVYDESLLAKCKMAVVNVLLIRELWFMKWMENDGAISVDEQAELAHWYVREIENSDENMEQWESLMQRNPRFALKKILKVLGRGAILNFGEQE